jgi:flagellar assembly factor FliW
MNTIELLTLKNTRFGDIEFDAHEVVTFPEGLIGFPLEKEFVLVATPQASSFVWLQSLSTPALAFLLTDPAIYVQDYCPLPNKLPTEQIMTTVNIPHGNPQDMTINLSGPICFDVASKQGKQIVLDHEAYTTKYRVFAEKCQTLESAAA